MEQHKQYKNLYNLYLQMFPILSVGRNTTSLTLERSDKQR